MAVQNQWGDRDFLKKSHDLASQASSWFSQSNDQGQLYIDDLERILDEGMVVLFNTEIEDGSFEEEQLQDDVERVERLFNKALDTGISIQLGMASALETLCGQAFGAKQHHMLGIYLQRSWIILLGCAILLLPLYIFTTPILRLLGQDKSLAKMVISGHLGSVRSSGFDPSNSWFLLFGRVIVFASCIGCIVSFI